MKGIEIDLKNLDAASAVIPGNVPVLMLNLLRYKEQADYDQHDLPPCSGREAYQQRYIPAFLKIAADMKGIQPFWVGKALASLVAPQGETWEDIALVEYPNFAAFRTLIESPVYAADAIHHRLASLEDWRLFVTVKVDYP